MLLAGQSVAYADGCSALRAPAASIPGQSPEVAALNRQLGAVGALQRQRKCSGGETGGFFNACADLANRKAEVQRKLNAAARSFQAGAGALQGRKHSPGCARTSVTAKSQARNTPPQQKSSRTQDGGRNQVAGSILFCVRLSDGYRFPAPNSQFDTGKDLGTTLDICRYICEDQAMDVYVLPRSASNSAGLETDDLVAVESGRKYSDLKTANAYQSAASFKACGFQRYHDRVEEARARTVTPYNMANAVVPVPASKPASTSDAEAAGSSIADAGQAMPARKKVRLVGTTFFPTN